MTPTNPQPMQATHTTTSDRPVDDMPCERRMLTKAQVAARLGCCERSVERLVKQGRFPRPRRFGRAVVWFESVVEHVLGCAEQEQLQALCVAREPALEDLAAPARKPRNVASSRQRRRPSGVSALDLEALREVVRMPTV